VIAHVVLFRPRPNLSDEERRALVDAWSTALAQIPAIRRARVGRRIRIGRSYEGLTTTDLPYAAILEFDDVEGLRAYLDHAAHEPVATQLFATIEEALIYDFEMEANADALIRR
jgi:Stress responsive A/B Barrel Domain